MYDNKIKHLNTSIPLFHSHIPLICPVIFIPSTFSTILPIVFHYWHLTFISCFLPIFLSINLPSSISHYFIFLILYSHSIHHTPSSHTVPSLSNPSPPNSFHHHHFLSSHPIPSSPILSLPSFLLSTHPSRPTPTCSVC